MHRQDSEELPVEYLQSCHLVIIICLSLHFIEILLQMLVGLLKLCAFHRVQDGEESESMNLLEDYVF